MKSQFRAVLRDIDERLPSYFLVKGGRLHPIPETQADYDRLIQGGYEHVTDGVDYASLDRRIIAVLNQLLNELGQRALLLFPMAVSAIISYEAGRKGSLLHEALYGDEAQRITGQEQGTQSQDDRKQKRRGK